MPLGKPTSLGLRLAVTGAGLVLLYLRKGDALRNPQLWAEDGTVFFKQQYDLGWRCLIEPYAGYLHLFPRLVAGLAELLPYAFTPAIYNGCALLLALSTLFLLQSSRLDLPLRPWFALVVVLVPQLTGEAFLNLTNAQAFLALLLVKVLIAAPPQRAIEAGGDVAVLVLAGLTGPFVVLLWPFFLVAAARERHLGRWLHWLLATGTAAVQLYVWRLSPILSPGEGGADANVAWRLAGHRLVGNLFFGQRWPYQQDPVWLALGGLIALVLLIAIAASERSRRFAALVFAGFAGALVAATVYKYQRQLEILIPAQAGARYLFLPAVMVGWLCLLGLAARPRFVRVVPLLLLFALVQSSLLSDFLSKPWRDRAWAERAKTIGQGEPQSIPIHPAGWRIQLAGRPRQKVEGLSSAKGVYHSLR